MNTLTIIIVVSVALFIVFIIYQGLIKLMDGLKTDTLLSTEDLKQDALNVLEVYLRASNFTEKKAQKRIKSFKETYFYNNMENYNLEEISIVIRVLAQIKEL